MGLSHLKNKPEADSFKYAYVEDADGNIVKVATEKIKSVLGIDTRTAAEVTLYANSWIVSDDGDYYTQSLAIDGVTSNSKVDLNPTPAQIIQIMNEEISIFLANDDGVITAYSINDKPSTNMTFAVTITEVM